MTNAQKLLMIGGAPWLTRRDYPKLVGGLEAWFDETDPSSMIMDSANRVSLIADKSGNSSTNVLCLNGVAGNYASAPDSVPLSITGDILIEADLTPVSWANGANQMVASKCHNSGQYAYQLFLLPAGGLRLSGSANGTTFTLDASSSAAVSFSALQRGYIRATRQLSSGDVKFYTSTDGVNWVQLGTTQATTAATSYFDGTDILEIGTNVGGTSNRYNGLIHRVRIYNTYDSAVTPAFDANFATFSKLAATGTESSSNAATVTINTSGATGARISGARDRYQGTAASQQVYLPWSGTNYGYLNGVSGNYFSTPDAAPVSVTGSIDLRAYVAADDYTPTGLLYMLISKNTAAAGQFAYDFYINATGNLVFRYSPDGTALRTATSSVATGLTDRAIAWLRATYDSATGNVIFYTGGSADSPVWVQLGSTQVLTSGAIFDGTNAVAIGANSGNSGGFNLFFGTIYRAQIYNGIAGTLAFDFNPVAYVSGTTFLDSSSNAATITINGGAMIVTRTGLYSDGVNDYSKTPGFALAQPTSICAVIDPITWTNQKTFIDGHASNTMLLFQRTLSPEVGLYSGVSVGNISVPLATGAALFATYNGTLSAIGYNRGATVTGDGGTLSANGITFSVRGDNVSYFCDVFTSEEIFFSKPISISERSRLALYFARKHRLPAV